MKYLTLLLTLITCSCTSIPLEKEFNRIHKKKYVLDKYDCSNKSAEYYDALRKAGYKPQIITTHYYGVVENTEDGSDMVNMKTIQRDYHHAIVKCDGWYLCPTSGKCWRNIAWVYHFWRPNLIVYYTEEGFEKRRNDPKHKKEWSYE